MDGYHLEWASKKDIKQCQHSACLDVPRNSDAVLAENISEPFAVNDIPEKSDIPNEKIVQPSIKITSSQYSSIHDIQYSLQDTLKKKDKPKRKHDAPMKDDVNKDVTKANKKIPWQAIAGFFLGILNVPFFFLTFLSVFFLIFGLIFSVQAIVKIEKNRDKYYGMGFAIAGLALNLLYILLVAFILAVLAYL